MKCNHLTYSQEVIHKSRVCAHVALGLGIFVLLVGLGEGFKTYHTINITIAITAFKLAAMMVFAICAPAVVCIATLVAFKRWNIYE